MIRAIACLLIASCCLPCAWAASSGRVFDDIDRDGVRDGRERGIADVAVSNGRDVVRTDADGRYALPDRAGAVVFVVKPAGWRVADRSDAVPAFWRRPAAQDLDFALRRGPRDDGVLDVLVFADPQPKSTVDVGYYRRDIVDPLAGRVPAALGVSLGDIVDDDHALYPAVNAATARLGVPWLHAAGNHDVDADAPDDASSLRSFGAVYGPDSFAWEEAAATFVVLDDVIHRPGATPAYIGGLRDDQFAFLANYLPRADKDRLLVVAVHIPLFEPDGRDTFRDADRAHLFALLQPFPHVLLLSAHNHTQQQVFHGAGTGWHGATPLHEYNVGAACGAFWSGVKDAAGIPDATMADGTPNGTASLRITRHGAYTLAWHPARQAAGDPSSTAFMALHAPAVLRRGAYPAWGVYANVFMAGDDSRVEFRIDDGAWRPMARVSRPDPRLLAENARDDDAGALRGYDRSPEATASPHLWRAALPTDLDAGDHRVEVRTFDSWQGEQRAVTHYRLDEAAP